MNIVPTVALGYLFDHNHVHIYLFSFSLMSSRDPRPDSLFLLKKRPNLSASHLVIPSPRYTLPKLIFSAANISTTFPTPLKRPSLLHTLTQNISANPQTRRRLYQRTLAPGTTITNTDAIAMISATPKPSNEPSTKDARSPKPDGSAQHAAGLSTANVLQVKVNCINGSAPGCRAG